MATRLRPLTHLSFSAKPSRYTAAAVFKLTKTLPLQSVRYNSASNAGNNMPLTTLDVSEHPNLPASSVTLFAAKAKKAVSFETIAKELGRDEVAVAALFYGQTTASEEDVKKLSEYFGIDHGTLATQLSGFPDRGNAGPMPPKEPLIYRLYEIVQNYGYAYKAVLNEKFGDGIMSAIAFSTHVDKEVDKDGVTWVNIKLRGKWLPFTRF